jgi:hypothetical protein
MSEKTRMFWVIFGGHEEIGGPGTRYVTSEGTLTHEKKLAAKFITHADAEEFARSKNIKIDSLTRFISVMMISRTRISKIQLLFDPDVAFKKQALLSNRCPIL